MSGGFSDKAKWLGLAVLIGVAFSSPLSAQRYSEGYKFLQAVEKKEGDEVNEMLNAPGSTIVNARDISTNRTALHIVVDRRDSTWLSFLLGKGADPNLADNKGVTPLLLAVRIGFHAGVETLVKKGARVDEANSAGETPLINAVHQRDMDLLKTLLAAGANPDRSDSSGRTARDYARLQGAQSAALAEIERSASSLAERRSTGAVYGPS